MSNWEYASAAERAEGMEAYDESDPKNPDWEDAMADRADMERKQAKEDRDWQEEFNAAPEAMGTEDEATGREIDRLAEKFRPEVECPDPDTCRHLGPHYDNPDDPALD